ncbi:MAG: cytochrome C [Burkholderiales bacterium]|jgi:cytochrome c|nr:cytochrome C [Burkholderiales bacterium]
MKILAIPLLMAMGAVHASQPLSQADAKSAMELAKSSGCFSCHSAAEKVVGPSYSSVAAKYSDDKDAVASLAQSIQYGSKGKWGRIPMPPHAALGKDDLNLLARWILTVQK